MILNSIEFKVEHIRYIGGFGQIHWLDLEDFLLPEPTWVSSEKSAIEHMNEDHVDPMKVMCSYYKNYEADNIIMTHLYPDGCVLKVDNKTNIFLPYTSEVEKRNEIRIRLVEMTQTARGMI